MRTPSHESWKDSPTQVWNVRKWKNMQEIGSQLQTCRLKLISMQQTLKDCEKELVNVKG
jgi:hypothetical protein